MTEFAAARVARLATVDESGRPHLVPVTFALDGEIAYIAVDHKPKTTRNLKRLRNIEANPQVSLLVDEYTEDWTQLWWIRADGIATVLRDQATFAEPTRVLAAKYPQYQDNPPQGPVIRIHITHWSSWHA
ncbi:MAG TPA: TIGR03668 family PPOX class F420-dependent oxidoreductase [Pseudonocardiaceae bacterium]|jgi:PPOX class probable F420-dependent enzyme|nr:TIGR03668 family PPOX class F420-dependent oxidoreductase [Pseudonocardiaceae bacterium]